MRAEKVSSTAINAAHDDGISGHAQYNECHARKELKLIKDVLLDTFRKWQTHNAARMAAALSYYTLFSLAPLMIVAVAVAGAILGNTQARAQLGVQMRTYMGADMANMVLGLINTASQPSAGIIATIVGIATLILGSSGLFGELQADLNTLWEVSERTPKGFFASMADLIKNRLVAFLMVLGLGVLLVFSSVTTTVLTGFGDLLGAGSVQATTAVIQALSFVVLLVITTLAFAVIFRVLPDTKVRWSDVWVGATFTSLLFNVGCLLIGLYLSVSRATSAYAAASSLVALLLWVNYSAQVFLFGAEFTHVIAVRQNERHRRSQPAR